MNKVLLNTRTTITSKNGSTINFTPTEQEPFKGMKESLLEIPAQDQQSFTLAASRYGKSYPRKVNG